MLRPAKTSILSVKALRIVLGITGASGVIYGIRLAEELRKNLSQLTTIVSDAAKTVIATEVPDGLSRLAKTGPIISEHDLEASVSSGSTKFDASIICPCSMKSLSAIANGFAYNLICRNVDVAIKEHRKVVLVIRETPLSEIHLENMIKLARLGVTIMPASPGFYHNPASIDDVVNHVVGKILDSVGIETSLYKRWSD
jgi:4-hydroxy-3-polyprenylbenzoate decarboxylase